MDKLIITNVRKISNYFNNIFNQLSHPDITLIQSYGHKLYVNKNDIGVAQPLILCGVLDKHETDAIGRMIKPGMTILDVGANIGYFTLIAAKLAGKTGKVYAFEPQPENFRLLVRNIRANDYHNIIPINKALSNKNGTIRLFIDKLNLGAHSLSERNLIDKGGFVDVKTTTLDHFLKSIPEGHIDFIKMDTQGAEGLILEGADFVLRYHDLKMIIEFWPWGLKSLGTNPLQLLKKLEDYGFIIKVIDETNQSIRDMDFVELIKACENNNNGWGFYNLLLEKKSL